MEMKTHSTQGAWPIGRVTPPESTLVLKPFKITDTWIRCNRGTGPHDSAFYPCFDLNADRADYDARGKRFFWAAAFMLVIAILTTWLIWSGR